jgi:hypothetical protein
MTPYDELKWGVQVVGPDDLLAANNFQEAAHYAENINQMMVDFKEGGSCTQYHPVIYANVVEWPEDRKHEPENTVWDDYK